MEESSGRDSKDSTEHKTEEIQPSSVSGIKSDLKKLKRYKKPDKIQAEFIKCAKNSL